MSFQIDNSENIIYEDSYLKLGLRGGLLKVFLTRNFCEKVFGHKNLEIRRTSLACSPVFRDLKNFDSEALQVASKSNPPYSPL